MKIVLAIIVALAGLFAIDMGFAGLQEAEWVKGPYPPKVYAQDGKPVAKVYKPTEIQELRLKVAQKDAQLAQNLLQQAQQNFQKALTDLGAEGEKVKLENGWDKKVTFNPNDLSFSEPAEVKK